VIDGFLSNGEYAKLRGVSKGMVSRWYAGGELVTQPHPTNKRAYLIDVEKTDQLHAATKNANKLKPQAQIIPDSALQEGAAIKLDTARITRDSAALDLAERLGQLVDLDIVEARRAREGRLIREKITDALTQQAARLATMTDARTISALIRDKIDTIFTNLAKELDDEIRNEEDEDTDADDDEDDLA
jgi:hypothetical protein